MLHGNSQKTDHIDAKVCRDVNRIDSVRQCAQVVLENDCDLDITILILWQEVHHVPTQLDASV